MLVLENYKKKTLDQETKRTRTMNSHLNSKWINTILYTYTVNELGDFLIRLVQLKLCIVHLCFNFADFVN